MRLRWLGPLVVAVASLPRPVAGQTDPRLVAAVRLAQDGLADSARAVAAFSSCVGMGGSFFRFLLGLIGLLLAGGIDFATVGAQGWRGLVATAPQYHENHMLSGPLLFNLLMARSWPTAEDAREAWAVCEELGLRPLIERMPAGLQEIVGETGWQLSQGERSRVFLARAILQGAQLVILDESFAALDPETLDLSLQCVLRRAPSLLVIAHP